MPDPAVRPESQALLLDAMLGKLAVYLRMCGYDTAYVGDRSASDEAELRARSREEGRLLLSRDAGLVDGFDAGVRLTERDVSEQLHELDGYGFELSVADPPTRCGQCNGQLEPVPAGAERPEYAPPPHEHDCWRCVDCGQYFWKGSHWDRVREELEGLGGTTAE